MKTRRSSRNKGTPSAGKPKLLRARRVNGIVMGDPRFKIDPSAVVKAIHDSR